ncbi:phage tail tape measure protein [Paraburkholderia nodosa]|uniref:phage tail tape measure protein n=1 Tax=Paraburkholderia nodosa TaxID=392320 RepID=UPI00084145E6|nr:phage tail tape measure protein [Paraburkholderia nodosa]
MANETVVRLTGDSTGYVSAMDRARKSMADFMTSQAAYNQRMSNSVKAVDDVRKALSDQGQAAVDAFSKTQRTAESWLTALQKQADQAGKTRTELMALRAAELGVSDAAQQYIDKIKAADAATAGAGHSAAGARTEMLVLGHEMLQGNWSRFGGSMMVMAERLDALKYLANPVALGIAAMGAAAYGMYKAIDLAAERAHAFNDAMNTTAGWAGQTRESVQGLAEALSARFGVSVGKATDDLNQIIASGRVSADVFPQVGTVAEAMAKSTGEAFDKVLDSLLRQQDDVRKAAEEYQASHHTMTEAQMSLIDQLDKTGRKHEAFAILVQQELADIDMSSKTHTSAMIGYWDNVMAAWDRYTRALSGKSTDLDVLNDLKAKQAAQQSGRTANFDYTDYGPLIAAQQKIVDANNAEQAAADRNKKTKTLLAESQESVRKEYERTLSPAQKLTEAIARDNEIIDNRIKLLKQAGPLQPALTAQLEAQRKQMIAFDSQKIEHPHAARTNDNAVNADLSTLQNQQKQIEDALRTSLEHIKALRADGLISEQDALTQSYVAEQGSLQKRIDLDKQMEDLARGKKNAEAYRKYADDIARLQQQMTGNYQKFADDTDTLAKKQTDALKVYTDSLTEQLKTQQTAADQKLAGLSMGTSTRADYDAQIKLMEDYDKKRAALAKSLTEGRLSKDQYNSELQATQAYYDSAVEIARKSSDDILAANRDWTVGASRAIQEYADSAKNVAGQVDSMFTSMAKGMEDSLATFATSGKLNFRSLIDSMISDLVRMQARMAMSSLFSMASEYLGSAFSAPSAPTSYAGVFHLADGGHVFGPGTSTSDSIPAMLSNGEYVLNASAVSRIGVPNLDAINSGTARAVGSVAHFARGGAVSPSVFDAITPASSGSSTQFNIEINSSDGGNSFTQQDAVSLKATIQTWMDQRMDQKMKGQGGYAWQIRNRSV